VVCWERWLLTVIEAPDYPESVRSERERLLGANVRERLMSIVRLCDENRKVVPSLAKSTSSSGGSDSGVHKTPQPQGANKHAVATLGFEIRSGARERSSSSSSQWTAWGIPLFK
jgi:hypothetical protein